MNKTVAKKEEVTNERRQMIDMYYKKVMRILEYYVLTCFILVTFVPLLNFSWIPGMVKLIYFTGFPLLILIFLISLFKDLIQNLLARVVDKKVPSN